MIAIPKWSYLDLPVIESTNSYALGENLNNGTIVRAHEQTAGKGSHGRTWVSAPGDLKATIILDVPSDVENMTNLSLLTAVAVGEAIYAITGSANLSVKYKWPNDIFVNGMKCGGILIESSSDTSKYAVGIGVNLISHPSPDDLVDGRYEATDLQHLTGEKIEDEDLLKMIIVRFAALLTLWNEKGHGAIQQKWKAVALGFKETITIKRPNQEDVTGTFVDLNPDGSMVLSTEDRGLVTIVSGQMLLRRAMGK